MENLTKDDIRGIFKEVVAEERKAFWVDAETHWIDHQFISSVRESGRVVGKTSLRVLVGALLTGILGWIYYHIKN